jgi:hypothetical protein
MWVWKFFDECVQDLEIPEMWENLSYVNDLHPSFGIHGLQIFIAHKDKARREWSDMPRFYVVLEDLEKDIFEEKFECEDWNDLLDFVANYRDEKKCSLKK